MEKRYIENEGAKFFQVDRIFRDSAELIEMTRTMATTRP